jgi:hypothetical protein
MTEKEELAYIKDSVEVVLDRISDYFCNNLCFDYGRSEIEEDLGLILEGKFKKEDRG